MSVLIAMQVSVTLALGGLLGATVAEGAPPASQAGRQPGLFAFEAGGVFTIRADGTGNRDIVFDGHNPEWSPDGSRLLYDLGGGGMGGLWSADAEGADARLIIGRGVVGSASALCDASFGATDGSWAGSGRRVAFVAQSEDERERPVQHVCTAAADGSRVRGLREGSHPDWFPGARRIAFIAPAKARQSFSSRVATMRRDGRRVRVLLGDDKAYRHDLDVSPDGHRLAFLEAFGSGFYLNVLRIMDLQTRRTRTIPGDCGRGVGEIPPKWVWA